MGANAPIEIGKTHSVTSETANNIMLGSGVVCYGLKYATDKWTYDGVFGATNGGSKVEIKPEQKDLEIDGILVKTKGLTVKVGETATLTTNLAEITSDNLAMVSTGVKKKDSTITGFDEIVSKPQIDEGDYIENLGFIGYTIDGQPIIIKFDHAICTSGLSFDTKNKEQTTVEATFNCVATSEAKDLTTLPWHIYKKAVSQV